MKTKLMHLRMMRMNGGGDDDGEDGEDEGEEDYDGEGDDDEDGDDDDGGEDDGDDDDECGVDDEEKNYNETRTGPDDACNMTMLTTGRVHDWPLLISIVCGELRMTRSCCCNNWCRTFIRKTICWRLPVGIGRIRMASRFSRRIGSPDDCLVSNEVVSVPSRWAAS